MIVLGGRAPAKAACTRRPISAHDARRMARKGCIPLYRDLYYLDGLRSKMSRLRMT